MGERTIVIGVAGGTGSGKSTLVRKLQEAFSDAVTTLSHDYYYRAYPDLTYSFFILFHFFRSLCLILS